MVLTIVLLLIVAAAGAAVLYPVFPCLDCAARRSNPRTTAADYKNCGYCYGKGRATVFDHLKGKRDPALFQPADLRIAPK